MGGTPGTPDGGGAFDATTTGGGTSGPDPPTVGNEAPPAEWARSGAGAGLADEFLE